MIANVDVLSMALLHSVTGNEDGALVVTIDWIDLILIPSSLIRVLIQIACLEQSEIAIYSASMKDKATVFWVWDLHNIMPLASLKK